MLDRTQQRIVGVLVEKELAVPESYPLTEKAVIAACNQKSNRDPEMGLEPFEVSGAMNALLAAGWVKTATSTGGYVTRCAHRLESNHAVDDREKAVLCELLLRGPQAPGALKPRVARLGFTATPRDIEDVLRGLAGRPTPLVEQLPKRPRERDQRWRHCLGPMDPAHGGGGDAELSPTPTPTQTATPTPTAAAAAARESDLESRVARLEVEVAELREAVQAMQRELQRDI